MREKIEKFLSEGLKLLKVTHEDNEYTSKLFIIDDNFALQYSTQFYRGGNYLFVEILAKAEDDFFYDEIMESFTIDSPYALGDWANYVLIRTEEIRKQEQAQNILNAWEDYEGIS